MTTARLIDRFDTAWRAPEELDALLCVARDCGFGHHDLLRGLRQIADSRGDLDDEDHAAHCGAFARLVEAGGDASLFGPTIDALGAVDATLRTALLSILPRINDPTDHPRLCAMLRAPEPEVRRAAADALRLVGGEAAYRALCAMMGETPFPGRLEAMDVAIAISGVHALPIVGAVLRRGNPEERHCALEVLAALDVDARHRAALENLIAQAADDADPKVAGRALDALLTRGAVDLARTQARRLSSSGDPARACTAIEAAARHRPPWAAGLLAHSVSDPRPQVAFAAIESLRDLGTGEDGSAAKRALAALVAGLEHPDDSVVGFARDAVERVARGAGGDPASAAYSLLAHPDERVRSVGEALVYDESVSSGLPSGLVWTALFNRVAEEPEPHRTVVATRLMSGVHPVDLVRTASWFDLGDPVLAHVALDAIDAVRAGPAAGAIPSELAMVLLDAALRHGDWWIRERALAAFAPLAQAEHALPVADLITAEPWHRRTGLAILHRLRCPDVAPYAAALLEDVDPEIRLEVLRLLDALDARSTRPAIAGLADDPDLRVVRTAAALDAAWAEDDMPTPAPAARRSPSDLRSVAEAASAAGAHSFTMVSGHPPLGRDRRGLTPLPLGPVSAAWIESSAVAILGRQWAPHELPLAVPWRAERGAPPRRAFIAADTAGPSLTIASPNPESPDAAALGLGEVVASFGRAPGGLWLVVGPPGSGRSTTIAALVGGMPESPARWVVGLEDPFEIEQARYSHLAVGNDFAGGRGIWQMDVDVVVAGDACNPAKFGLALELAASGHLVLATVRSIGCGAAVSQLMGKMAQEHRFWARWTVSETLRGVLCHHSAESSDEARRPRVEVTWLTAQARAMLRAGRIEQAFDTSAHPPERGVAAGVPLPSGPSLSPSPSRGHTSAGVLRGGRR